MKLYSVNKQRLWKLSRGKSQSLAMPFVLRTRFCGKSNSEEFE